MLALDWSTVACDSSQFSLQGEILINGTPLHKVREWFIVNTGYVRQLAKSYYDELTVRENLLFSMSMRAQKGMKLSQKLERVEQVIRETGLLEQADIKVGDGIGLGLSGGQVCEYVRVSGMGLMGMGLCDH